MDASQAFSFEVCTKYLHPARSVAGIGKRLQAYASQMHHPHACHASGCTIMLLCALYSGSMYDDLSIQTWTEFASIEFHKIVTGCTDHQIPTYSSYLVLPRTPPSSFSWKYPPHSISKDDRGLLCGANVKKKRNLFNSSNVYLINHSYCRCLHG